MERRKNNFDESGSYIIEGRNSILEAIRMGRTIDKVLYAEVGKLLVYVKCVRIVIVERII